jgi:hypothetical protein
MAAALAAEEVMADEPEPLAGDAYSRAPVTSFRSSIGPSAPPALRLIDQFERAAPSRDYNTGLPGRAHPARHRPALAQPHGPCFRGSRQGMTRDNERSKSVRRQVRSCGGQARVGTTVIEHRTWVGSLPFSSGDSLAGRIAMPHRASPDRYQSFLNRSDRSPIQAVCTNQRYWRVSRPRSASFRARSMVAAPVHDARSGRTHRRVDSGRHDPCMMHFRTDPGSRRYRRPPRVASHRS